MRTRKSLINAFFSIIAYASNLILAFLVRSFFVSNLNDQYLGLNGLASNVIMILSLVELGVGPAIVFSLYKPLATNDKEKIKTLMALFKKAYRIICIFIVVLGLMALPLFTNVLAKDSGIPNIEIIYILFILTSLSTYFLAYKQSLITADQKNYIVSIATTITNMVISILQIIILYFTKSFVGYLISKIICQLIMNIIISKLADRMYPYLADKNIIPLESNDKMIIIKNIKAMMMNRIGGIVVNGTASIFITSFAGLIAAGLYSNYSMITNAISGVVNQFFSAFTSSIGNLAALSDKNKLKETYDTINFLGYWVSGFCSICLISLLNPFIKLWIGDRYVLDFNIVLIIVIVFYINTIRRPNLIMHDSLGLYWHFRYKPLFESGINIATTIILGLKFGLTGILAANIVSTMITCFWVEPFYLYKFGFKLSSKSYFVDFIKHTLIFIVIGCITLFIIGLIKGNSLLYFCLKVILSVFIPNIIFIMLYIKRKEMKVLFETIKRILSHSN